jgi:hypothetical protein
LKAVSLCGVAYDALLIRMEEFHGYRPPAILVRSNKLWGLCSLLRFNFSQFESRTKVDTATEWSYF